jgi:REP element-mobilizing transposase RayT
MIFAALQRPAPTWRETVARSRYKIFEDDEYAPYFLTATVVNWLPLFNTPWVVDILLASLRFLQANGRITLYAFVIMENHLHLIAAARDLSKEIANFKSYTARQIIDQYRDQGTTNILHQLAGTNASTNKIEHINFGKKAPIRSEFRGAHDATKNCLHS